MVVKVYISTVSGNKSLKAHQEFICKILDVSNITYEKVDVSQTDKEAEKQFMRAHARPSGSDKFPLPPQVFNGEVYCGDYEAFNDANELGTLREFLKLESKNENSANGGTGEAAAEN